MFAQLGDIKFKVITNLNENISYNYAQHERINNKPILQFLGKNLIEEEFKLNFHRSFCNPEEEIKKLTDVANEGKPLKYIKGNGEYVGIFVIQNIGKTIEQATREGDLISIQLDLKLREFTGKIIEENNTEKGFKKK